MRDEHGAGRTRTATASVLAATLAAGVAAGVLGAETSAAQPVSLTLRYACAFPYIGSQDITASISMDVPQDHTVGEPSHRLAIHAEATVGSGLTRGLAVLGVHSIDGTLRARTRVTAPEGDLGFTVPLTVDRTGIPSSGSLRIPADGVAPAVTFAEDGRAEIVVGDFAAHLVPRDADGDPTLQELDVPCTVRGGQEAVLTSFTIAPAPRPSAPSVPRPSASAGPGTGEEPGPSGSATAGPSSVTMSATTGPSEATSSSNAASAPPGGAPHDDTVTRPSAADSPDGKDGRSPILPVAAVLVIAVAASIAGLRLRKRQGDEGGG
ncbi:MULTISPECIES: DUF6801 domain-containing protein [unclassified Streptomyces]|uniref:DUF6801 domain-containing protein n=1 Tax=unclassified Streptomyces TaxID=2593676 RepID=UPI000CD588BD|nr:DUF6801 domain-containing protein [Streptomyces sp. SM10]